MTARAKRNIANTLTLLGLAPALIWLLMMAMTLSGALLPWISAGVLLGGIYFVLLSLCVAGPALMWASALKASQPDIWTRNHRIPGGVAKLILFLGIVLNFGLWTWQRFHHLEPSTQVTPSAEESDRIQEQIDKKTRELGSLRR